MTGPNLLAWAKDSSAIAPELFCVSYALGALARAILADEEERKRVAAPTERSFMIYSTAPANNTSE